jgi:hypothetical protein
MKFFLIFLSLGLAAQPFFSRSAETAHATLWCASLKFSQGTDSFNDTLDLTTIGSTFNGELLPYSGDTWAANFLLSYNGFGYNIPISGAIYVNLPSFADSDGNGFDDFFQVSQGVATTVTSGNYTTSDDFSEGDVTATWSRAAGSKTGTCVINLNDDVYGDLGDYTATFDVLEYTGSLTYTPDESIVSGNVNLVQTGNSANTFNGPVEFIKVSTNHLNQLTLQSGAWTNASAQTTTFLEDIYSRDVRWPTNYYGFFDFDDGDLSTADADYLYWYLSIDDLNDADKDGIPDFSDDPAIAPPRNPSLALTPGLSGNLLLTISGDVGHDYEIQANTSLSSTNWENVSSVTLTTDPQTVSLSLPETTTKFWRVMTQ